MLDEESVTAATCKASNVSEGAVSFCSRRKPEPACLRRGRGGLTTAIEKVTGNVDRMVNTMLWMPFGAEAPPVSKFHRWRVT